MGIRLDHVIVPSRNRVAGARALAGLLDVPWEEEAQGTFAPVHVNETLTLDFADREQFERHHLCFHVGDAEFDAIFARLRAAGITYRSRPNGEDDMKINTRLGGKKLRPAAGAVADLRGPLGSSMILADSGVRDLARDLEAIVGGEHLIVDEEAQKRFLKDFSWYSPLLTTALADTTVDVVVRPGTLEELTRVVALGVRRRVPITARGAGTGNYGQSLPLARGILIDIRRLDRILDVGDASITLEPGVVLDDAEDAARARGRELCIMSTTHRVATAAGFVAGGSGGIGSVTYGGLWDGNVPAVDLLTAEDPPRTLHLSGADVEPVLHTYGTVGVITRVTLRLGPARPWREAYATFDSFDAAAEVAWRVASDEAIRKRLVSLQEAPIPTMFEPVKHLFTRGQSAVLLILDEAHAPVVRGLVQAAGGAFHDWPEKPAIHQFPYSHTILWSKKHDRASTWLQSRYAPTRERFFEQWRAVKARFGGKILHHFEFSRPRDGAGPLPSGIPVVTDPDPRVFDAMMAFFREIGIRVHNPHSYVVQEGGFVGGAEAAVALKRRTDPYGILNPGKLGGQFYEPRMGRAAAP